jgi:MFS family permease
LLFLIAVLFLRSRLPESERYLAVEARTTGPQPVGLLFRRPIVGPLVLVCVAVFAVQLTTEAVVFAIDFLESSRGMSSSTANLLLVAAGLVALPVFTFSGRISDRVGRRRVCIVGLILQSLGLLLFFDVARGALALGLCLALAYFGIFAAWTTGTAFAVELFPTTLRGAASSAAAMAKLLGQSASFALAAALLTVTHRPGITVAVLLIGPLSGAVLIALAIPETSGRELADVVDEPTVAAVEA